MLALKSADGFRWEKMQEEPVISDGAFDSLNIPVWDHVRGRYLAIYRDFTEGVRTIKIAESDDFLNWTPGEWGDFGDAPLEHLYTNGTAPYIRAPHIFLGFPKRFHPWRNQYPDSPRPGVSDAVLMSSRDGYHWHRHLEAFVRPGRDPRNWLNRNNLLAAGTVATAPDELSLYMLRNYKAPSLYLERMVLRTDGFVSVHAGHGGGEFVTKPLVFEGSNLVLNFATSAAGSIHVELQDAQGQVLPSFGLEESPMIWGDEIEYVVRWERDLAATTSDNPLRRIAGKTVKLRFVMKDADLYSIRFVRVSRPRPGIRSRQSPTMGGGVRSPFCGCPHSGDWRRSPGSICLHAQLPPRGWPGPAFGDALGTFGYRFSDLGVLA